MSEDIKRKIAKLLALAADKGASEDEAATAMRMASGLMMRYGIAQDDIKGPEQPKAKRGKHLHARFEKYQVTLANAAGYLFGCRVIFYDMGKAGILFVGRPENIDAAEMTMMWLTQQVERFYKEALPKGITQQSRSEYRKTFKWAASCRVEKRVMDLVAEMQRSNVAAQSATGSTALVVQGHFKQLLAEVEDEMKGVQTKSLQQKFGSGTFDGQDAGDRVKLRQELGAERKLLR